MATIEQLLRLWADEDLNEINQLLILLEKRLFYTYEPSLLPPRNSFWQRFDAWLKNVDQGDVDAAQTMFRLASEIFFVGPAEFLELYRFAYNGPIARWLVDEAGIDVRSEDAPRLIREAASRTWFCPISDSMKINSFYHVNNIPAKADFRPDWRSLAQFSDPNKIKDYCNSEGLDRLVLLEDFVGGGSQMRTAVQLAASLGSTMKTLIVPLIACPKGVKRGEEFQAANQGTIVVDPVVAIPAASFVTSQPRANEPEIHTAIRKLALATYARVSNGQLFGPAPYHPLGFPPPPSEPTGGLVVMFTNTPDNTVPLIHWPSESWAPLFPRHSRV